MIGRSAGARRIKGFLLQLVFIITATLCAVNSARAQVPPPPVVDTTHKALPDTTQKITPPRDSAFVRDSLLRVDSLRRAIHNDSLPTPFPQFVDMTNRSNGFASGTWEWNQVDLLREGHITLGDLLRRIPGLTALRSGGYEQPEAVTSFGLTRGRVQVEIDGYVLDPLAASTYDLAGIETVNLAAVRVERHLDMIRIKLTTAAAALTRPYTRLEVATGQPDINIFRAVFLVPKVIVGPFAASIDRVGADGTRGEEPASATSGWAKWSWSNAKRGVQLEYRRQNLKREGIVPWPVDGTRQDITMHARAQLFTGLTAELFGGHSSLKEAADSSNIVPPTDPDAKTDTVIALERGVWQGGARAAFARGGAYAMATLRLRDAAALPKQEMEVGAGFDAKMIHVGGDFGQQSWKTGPSASTYDVRAQAGPVAGLSAFVERASGDRGAPIYADSNGISILDTHETTKRSATRVGATLQRFGIDGGGALLKIDATSTAPFGLPFDSAFAASLVEPAQGFETWGRVGFFRNRFFVDASYTYYTKSVGWTDLPTRSWRIAGEVHLSPLPSGNLKIFGRVESVFRGPMLAYGLPQADPDSVNSQFEPLPQNSILNGYLQIRIIDVRAFIQWEDMTGKGRLDVPNRLIPGPRVYYGVKWELFN